jgi:hypothetical protein
MSRREHYSTALAQSQGIVSECLSLFEIWDSSMSLAQLFEVVRSTNVLNMDSERRLRNIVIEGFGSRFLREPYLEAAPSLKEILTHGKDLSLLKQIVFLYAIRQHGIFFDFLTDEYWPAVRAGGSSIRTSDIQLLIDRGLVSGRLEKNWSESVRKRVSSYVLGIATDFDLLAASRTGDRPILSWSPHDSLILYLTYDLHFMGASDDEVANSPEWQAIGLQREDVTLYLNRLQNQGHLIAQDTGHLCRIDWKYTSREELAHVIIS